MVYLDVQNDEVKRAVTPAGFEDNEFFTEGFTQDKFESLLERLEDRTRAIINNQLMGQTLEFQEDRVDTFESPDKEKLQLPFPIQDVKKVEVRAGDDENGNPDFEELNDTLFRTTEQFVIYKGRLNQTYRQSLATNNRNSLKRYSSSATWADRCTQVRVTYDRGFEEIPSTVLEVQEEMIRRMLTHLRQEQNLASVDPQSVQGLFNNRQILTDDLKNRIGKITQAKNKYLML